MLKHDSKKANICTKAALRIHMYAVVQCQHNPHSIKHEDCMLLGKVVAQHQNRSADVWGEGHVIRFSRCSDRSTGNYSLLPHRWVVDGGGGALLNVLYKSPMKGTETHRHIVVGEQQDYLLAAEPDTSRHH